MTLVFLLLILGSTYYMVRVLLEYREHQMVALQKIQVLEGRLERTRTQLDEEGPLLEKIRTRIRALRGFESDRKLEQDRLRQAVQSEEGRYDQLSVEIQKRQFRGRIQQARKLVVR